VAPHCGVVRGGVSRSGVGGAKGGDQGECGLAKHALDSEPGSRVTGAGLHAAASIRRWAELVEDKALKSIAAQGEVNKHQRDDQQDEGNNSDHRDLRSDGRQRSLPPAGHFVRCCHTYAGLSNHGAPSENSDRELQSLARTGLYALDLINARRSCRSEVGFESMPRPPKNPDKEWRTGSVLVGRTGPRSCPGHD
jgi:hypothetical protein